MKLPGFSWIDMKLAGRMLVRFPGFTLISTIGLAVGIAISAAAFVVVSAMMTPALPLPDGDRIVSVLARDVSTSRQEERLLPDVAAWQRAATLRDTGVVRAVSRNLLLPGRVPETITLAEMSASGFRVAGVAPLMGRHLQDADEQASAPDVVVIGYTEWQRRFESDAAIIGRQIQIGERVHTVVGVMPEGFGFPVSDSFWTPWQVDATAFTPRSGPAVSVFAKLAPEATLDHAQAELSQIGLALGAASPSTHEHLRPIVVPYTFAYTEMHEPENALAFRAIQTGLALLLMVVCVNVAILVYARTATRQGEIAVRTALGASRLRIVAQLFVEALVLAGLGAAVGLLLVRIGLTQLDVAVQQVMGPLPFWMELRLTTNGVLYIAGLTVLAAAVIGIIPALKATSGQVRERLQGLSGGGGAQMQMGRVWTGLIVTQVALTVTLLPASMFHVWDSLRSRTPDSSIAAQQLLTAEVGMERSPEVAVDPARRAAFGARYASRLTELESRLEAEPSVDDVTFSLVNAGTELAMIAEAEGLAVPSEAINYNIVEGNRFGHLVRFNNVTPDFFDAYNVTFQLGRPARPGTPAIVVNRTFVDRVFGGDNPIGRRIRYVGRSREAGVGNVALNQWYDIVGVVPDFPFTHAVESRRDARVYHAVAPGQSYPMSMVVKMAGATPSDVAGRVRDISAAVDPTLQLRDLSTYQDVMKREEGILRVVGAATAAAISSVILLSAAGIYALMSFTVSRRRKEIGIRTALGANQRHILMGIFARVSRQLGSGAALGVIGAFLLDQLLEGDGVIDGAWIILPIAIALMGAVGLAASWGPARRGLKLDPMDALRNE